MLTQSQFSVAAPLILAAFITFVMTPFSTMLTAWRTERIYKDTDGVIYGVDLYSTSGLCLALPFITLVAGLNNAHAALVFLLWIGVFIGNLIALIWILITKDHTQYVDRYRLLFWSYPVLLTVLAMIAAAVIGIFLS